MGQSEFKRNFSQQFSFLYIEEKRFTNLKNFMVRAGPYSTGLLTETIKIQVVSVARKISENVFDYLSSFICLAIKKIFK